MVEVPLEGLLDKVGSVYKLVILASRRALELNEGARPLVEIKDDQKVSIALEEIMRGKIKYRSAREKSK